MIEWLKGVVDYYTLIALEDILVFLGGGFFFAVIVILLVARRFYKFEPLPTKYEEDFTAISYKFRDTDPETILIKTPKTYRESVDRVFTLLSMSILHKHHYKESVKRLKSLLIILVSIMGIAFVVAIYMITHVVEPY